MYSFPNLELVHCSTSGSNCCFLTCIQISQEAGQVVWYPYLLKNFSQFVVIYTVKGFGVKMFFPLPFSMIQQMLPIWSLVLLPFLNPVWTFGSSQFMYCWSLTWRNLSITLLACEMSAIVWWLSILWHYLSWGLEWKLTFSNPVATAEFSKFADIFQICC